VLQNVQRDVGTAYRQPSVLELVGVPTRAGADLEGMTCRDCLGQARQRPGQDTVTARRNDCRAFYGAWGFGCAHAHLENDWFQRAIKHTCRDDAKLVPVDWL
jgi:hypothetical protein